MTTTTVDTPPGWDRPLGADLPQLGPPILRVWPLVSAGFAALVLLGVAGWMAYLWYRPLLGTQYGTPYPTAKHAAMSWRQLHAEHPEQARGLEMWQFPSDEGGSMTVLVRPPDAEAEEADPPEGVQFTKLYKKPEQKWELLLRRLSPSQQSLTLGDETLSRGTIFVALKAETTLLFASDKSPDTGYVHKSHIGLAPFDACLPLLEKDLQGGTISTPMNAAGGKDAQDVYWITTIGSRATVLVSKPCGEGVLEPNGAKSVELSPGAIPLLTFYHGAPNSPLVLAAQPEGSRAPHELYRYRGKSMQALQKVHSFAAANVYDSYDNSIGSDSAEVPVVRVRKVTDDVIEYLVPQDDAWQFAACAAPNPAQYIVANAGCSFEDEAIEAKLPDSLQVLTPEEIKSCVVSTSERYPGCYLSGWRDSSCDIRLLKKPCGIEKNGKK